MAALKLIFLATSFLTASVSFDIRSLTIILNGDVATESELAALFAETPELEIYISKLRAVNRVVTTPDGKLQLYSGSQAITDFQADSIIVSPGALTVVLSESVIAILDLQRPEQQQDYF
jgi:hypothetical protein